MKTATSRATIIARPAGRSPPAPEGLEGPAGGSGVAGAGCVKAATVSRQGRDDDQPDGQVHRDGDPHGRVVVLVSEGVPQLAGGEQVQDQDRKSTRLNSSH